LNIFDIIFILRIGEKMIEVDKSIRYGISCLWARFKNYFTG